ncbi:hypothetical protein GGI25_003419 [Coemansia spiralis]|uniref:Uncharacterized protein n=2 Tax=Coemansia TaxID=4863 RepID=A0A9W8G762_9FUNG|nr:hypothetical protein EDC05_001677 [Coemansia umbellata]KAJ2621227.1 hypothetical protein GGI26_004300 [Coemansia sp. RSA 1358]KAJ2676774.1 hypothetical protein GGI25_003419 [Coemansia spiralis]
MLASKYSLLSDLLRATHPQEIELGTVDLANGGIRVDGIYFYKNIAHSSDFMSLDTLSRSLYKLIADHYPILVGRPRVNSEGKAVVTIDPDNLCLPDIKEVYVDYPAELFFINRPNADCSNSKDIHFFDLHKFYNTSGISRIPCATYHRDNASVVVRIFRFKNSAYTALAYSMPHTIFDATSMILFMNHWAEYARNIENSDYVLESPPDHNRSIMYSRFDNVGPAELPFIKHFKETAAGTLQIQSPENIAPILIATPDIPQIKEQHLLHISNTNLERMRRDIDSKQTTAMVLTAALTKSILQANIKSFENEPHMSYVAIAYDCRQRSGVPHNFAGNASLICIAPLFPKTVLDSSHKELAQIIRKNSMKTDSSYSKAAIKVIEEDVGLLYHASFSLCNTPQTSYFGFSNVRYMQFKTIDFGFGSPELLSFDYFSKEGMCRMYPNYQDGGIDLFLNYADSNFEHVRKDDFLAKYIDIIY